MDFNFTDDQKEIEKSILDLARHSLNDGVFEDDAKGIFPARKWKAIADIGITGIPIPEEYGGLGRDMLTTAIAIRALGYGCRDEGIVFSVCAHMLTCSIPIRDFGTEDQKRAYLPKLCSGEYVGGNGMSEADAGSDISSISTRALKDGECYLLRGAKIFVTNGPVANLLVIYARHPDGMKMLDISAFLVETRTEGFSIGQVFDKMGLTTSPMSEVLLDGCRIHARNLLGRERMGASVFNLSMLWERIIMAAYHIGSMEQQYELCVKYAGMRGQFGKKIIRHERVSDRLVDMQMKIETSKLMLYKTAWDYDNGNANLSKAAMLKLIASEAKVKNSLDAVKIFGAYGYIKESDVEKQLRDSIAATIYSGTSDIQRKIIAENLEEGL
jgi:alkylation response protein AidB-like acyl-CoA dehydrogenase